METMIKEYIASFIRNLLTPVTAYLLATGYFTQNEVLNLVGAIAVMAVAVIWGLVNKFLWKQTAETALALPATKSDAKLSDVLSGEVTTK